MKLKTWFHNRYNSGADKTASERLAVKKIKKHEDIHNRFASAFPVVHRNDTNRPQRIIDPRAIEL